MAASTQDADSARQAFASWASGPDEAVDLASAALCIAAEATPGLDRAHYLAQIDALAARTAPALRDSASAAEATAKLNTLFFEDEGFRGNEDDYYDPRNSFLNDVLDRRRGIPISLSILYIEVARRSGLEASGIGFPGHFLARIGGESGVLVDAFHARVVTENDCADWLRDAFGPKARFKREMLDTTPNKRILLRLLSNLKQIYLRQRNLEDALQCSDRMILLDPEAALEIRDRGLLYQALECHGAAQSDLEQFLEMEPGHESAPQVLRQLEKIRGRVRQMH